MSLLDHPLVTTIRQSEGNTAVVCLPGILATAGEQFAPLIRLLPAGTVVGVDVQNEMFVARLVKFLKEHGHDRVILLGASMGGMFSALVVESTWELWRTSNYRRADYYQLNLDWLESIIIDAPSGSATMKELPSWATPLVQSGLSGPMVGFAITKFLLKGPKDDELDVPNWQVRYQITGRSIDRDDWSEFAKQKMMADMSRYTGRQWWSQVSWMIRVGRDGSLLRAAREMKRVKTTYLACVHSGNVTVAQPDAANWWQENAGAKVIEVDAVHCGFMQQPERFDAPIRMALSP